jgi:hypothetical protein
MAVLTTTGIAAGLTATKALSIGATAASAGMSFSQMQKQRGLQIKAQEAATKAIGEARKRLDVNFYDALSLPKEPYELEREALLTSGAQAMEAARESQRGVAGTAGRLQMAQNAQQGQVRSAMGRDLMALEARSATEDARLRDENVVLDTAEAAGAQLAQANAWEAEQMALQGGMRSIAALSGQIGSAIPQTGANMNLETPQAPQSQNGNILNAASKNLAAVGTMQPQVGQLAAVGGQYNIGLPETGGVPNLNLENPAPPRMNGMQLSPEFQGVPLQSIIQQYQASGVLPPDVNMIDYNELFKLIYQ